MASHQEACSSDSSSNFNSAHSWKYDVFLSFRGEDTRKSFTDHLYAGLCRQGFKVFRDEEELERGEIISVELLKIIEQSRVAIVVVSLNYASSSWCLDELQHIIVTSRNELHVRVLPIFYNVDPSHVRKLEGTFGEGFDRLKERFHKDKVEIWRCSLMLLGDIAGWNSKEWYESELINNVATNLWDKLYAKLPPPFSDKLIGVDRRIREIELLMMMRLDDTKFIGIWGMGGAGKTTLAEAIYERFCNQFDFHCFVANVREDSERYGLFSLQKNLLLWLIGQENIQIEDTFKVKNAIQNHFRNKKVMLVLDDVTSRDQLTGLARPEWFGAGSRVIITSRDHHLLRSRDYVFSIYEVKLMNKDESLQLFCQKAFESNHPEEAFLEKSKLVINYADGLPLALHVLGDRLHESSADEWEKVLDMLKKDSKDDIFKTLKISYDALSLREKEIFLDIACFLNGWRTDEVTQILESCGFYATKYIRSLIKKSLLAEDEIDNNKCVKMHNLIQDMGRSIVWDESPNVERRSRLWSAEEIVKVLKKDMGTDATEGVALPDSFDTFPKEWIPTLSKMMSLRLFFTSCNNVDLSSGPIDLPCELKVLHWNGYPLETLLSGTKLDGLKYLKMLNSKTRQLHNNQMHNLKFLDLSHSKCLIEIPDFSIFQDLERLVLEGCKKLVKIDPSIGKLKSLVELNFKDCINLEILPTELEIASLEVFVLNGCNKVKKLPKFGERMKNLRVLDVKRTSIDELPMSLGYLINLKTFDLRGCRNLGAPHNIQKFKLRLKILKMSEIAIIDDLWAPYITDKASYRDYCRDYTALAVVLQSSERTFAQGNTSCSKAPEQGQGSLSASEDLIHDSQIQSTIGDASALDFAPPVARQAIGMPPITTHSSNSNTIQEFEMEDKNFVAMPKSTSIGQSPCIPLTPIDETPTTTGPVTTATPSGHSVPSQSNTNPCPLASNQPVDPQPQHTTGKAPQEGECRGQKRKEPELPEEERKPDRTLQV